MANETNAIAPNSPQSTNKMVWAILQHLTGTGGAGAGNNNNNSTPMGSESVVAFSNTSGLVRLDARNSRYEGADTGASLGLHQWTLSRQYNTVDLRGATTPIQITAGAKVTVNGLDVEKNTTGNSWNSSFYSNQAFDPNTENFAVSWLVESTTGTIREMGGLDNNPAQNNSYTSIDYAVYQVNNYFYSRVYEAGVATPVPNYTTFYLQVGDRVGIKCVNNKISYFVLRSGVETVIYTSLKEATVPLYFKAALNRGNTSSGASALGNVEWHTVQKSASNTIQITGNATDVVSNEDIELCNLVGIEIQAGTIYSDLQYVADLSPRYQGVSAPYPTTYVHNYIANVGQQTGVVNY